MSKFIFGILVLVQNFIFVTSTTSSSSSISITEATYDEVTSGKTVFIKFFAPWCGHCQELAPTWEKLASKFQSQQGIIGEVDCTKEEEWCLKLGITAFPTMLYGDPSHGGVYLEEFEGDKTITELYEFSEKTLHQSICSPGNLAPCDESTKGKIEMYWNMSSDDLKSSIQQQEGLVMEAEKKFDKHVNLLQSNYDKAARDYELNSAKLKRKVKFFKSLVNKQQSP